LPVDEVVYQLEEGEQTCDCGCGSLHEMTMETRSEIAIVPSHVKVTRHVRQVYA
jgi:transposase